MTCRAYLRYSLTRDRKAHRAPSQPGGRVSRRNPEPFVQETAPTGAYGLGAVTFSILRQRVPAPHLLRRNAFIDGAGTPRVRRLCFATACRPCGGDP